MPMLAPFFLFVWNNIMVTDRTTQSSYIYTNNVAKNWMHDSNK
jgi:hypothetical protein